MVGLDRHGRPIAPALSGNAATLTPRASYDRSDHVIFIGDDHRWVPPTRPRTLLFYRITFHDFGAVSGTTAWNGCLDDPFSGWFDAAAPFLRFICSSSRLPRSPDRREHHDHHRRGPESTVDRTKVNTAADCEANGTANFASRPMTEEGRDSRGEIDVYIESLRDDRGIWSCGKRVMDVTTHPAYRNRVRMTAPLYDAMHTGEHVDNLTTPTDTGSGGVTMMSIDDLAAMGRSYASPFATVGEAMQLAARRFSDRK
ncbi:4-hydroxyphenylacetate 3-monooxygenase (plasmid) [Rhodococcus sp. WAY2]|nr:4-hydroxyphenylacetate 3-monooxygenase [Rhodococcus sp. WAY2]